jgi:dTDP-4-amino-4,6-dideoxygalactose transaminase
MRVLDERVKQRRAAFDFYEGQFKSVKGIGFQSELQDSFSNRWLTTIVLDPEVIRVSKEKVYKALEKDNIESRPLWKPMHLQPVFRNAPYYGGKISESLFERGLCLPSGSNMTEEDLSRTSAIVLEAIES